MEKILLGQLIHGTLGPTVVGVGKGKIKWDGSETLSLHLSE